MIGIGYSYRKETWTFRVIFEESDKSHYIENIKYYLQHINKLNNARNDYELEIMQMAGGHFEVSIFLDFSECTGENPEPSIGFVVNGELPLTGEDIFNLEAALPEIIMHAAERDANG